MLCDYASGKRSGNAAFRRALRGGFRQRDASGRIADRSGISNSFEKALQSGTIRPGSNLLVLADQFEELFRYDVHKGNPGADRDEKAIFAQHLIECCRQRKTPIYVVLTMRSEFLGDCARFRELPEQINEGQYLVPRLTREERRAAIEGPIGVAGAAITPKLVQRLLNDFGDDPDQLPVMQHALMRTWSYWLAKREPHDPEAREDPLDVSDYVAIGGLENALSIHAQEAFTEACKVVPDGGADIVKRTFLLLRTRDEKGREVRRPTTIAEILAVTGAPLDDIRKVIGSFSGLEHTFLVASSEKLELNTDIDITHESLLREWPLLAGVWVREETESQRIYTRLARRAAEDEKDYLKGSTLKETLDWWNERKPNLAWAVRYHPDFHGARQLLTDSKNRRVYGLGGVVLTAVVLIAVVVSLIWANYIQAQYLAARAALVFSENENQIENSAYLAYSSLARRPSIEAQSVLSRALALMPSPLKSFNHPGVKLVDYSPHGEYLASVGTDGSIRIWSTSDNASKDALIGAELKVAGEVGDVAWTDENLLVGSGNVITEIAPNPPRVVRQLSCEKYGALETDGAGNISAICSGQLKLWLKGGGELPAFTIPAPQGEGTSATPRMLALSFWDGHELNIGVVSGSEDLPPPATPLLAASLHPPGGAEVQDCLSVYSLDILHPILRTVAQACAQGPLGTRISKIKFDARSRELIVAQDDGTVKAWIYKNSSRSDAEVRLTVTESIESLNEDANFLVTNDHGAAHLWYLPARVELARLTPPLPLSNVDLRQDGSQAAGLTGGNTILRWDLRNNLGRLAQEAPLIAIDEAAFHAAGRLVVLRTPDSSMVFDVVSGEVKWRRDRKGGEALRIAPDGRGILMRDEPSPGEFRLRMEGLLEGPAKNLWATPLNLGRARLVPAFGQDGLHLAALRVEGSRQKLLLCSAQSGEELHSWDVTGDDPEITGFLDGGRSVLVRSGQNLELFGNDGRRTRVPVVLSAETGAITLSHEGGRLAISGPNEVRIMETNSWEEAGDSIPAGRSTHTAFGAGGTRMLTAGLDGLVRLWDVKNQEELARFPELKAVRALALTPEGSVSVVQYFRVMNHPFRRDQIRKDLCDRVDPVLSQSERARYSLGLTNGWKICR